MNEENQNHPIINHISDDSELKIIFPINPNPKPKALIMHCSDARFKRAFRNFIEGDKDKGCMGYKEDDYISLIIPGGVSSMSDAMLLPKQFKVAKEQIEFLTTHFPTVNTIVLINHEDCAAYKALTQKLGSLFLKHISKLADRQHLDLLSVAKTLLGMENFKAHIKLYMAKFANPEHTKVTFEEIKI